MEIPISFGDDIDFGGGMASWETLLGGVDKVSKQVSDLDGKMPTTTQWNRLGNLLQSGTILRERMASKQRTQPPVNNSKEECSKVVSESDFSNALKAAILEFLAPQNVCKEWEIIFHLYNNGNQATAKREAKQLTGGYRLVANYYLGGLLIPRGVQENLAEGEGKSDMEGLSSDIRDVEDVLFNPRAWIRAVILPFFSLIVSSDTKTFQASTFSEIFTFDVLSKEVHEAIIDHLLELETKSDIAVHDDKDTQVGKQNSIQLKYVHKLLSHFSADWCNKAISLLLRRSFSHSSSASPWMKSARPQQKMFLNSSLLLTSAGMLLRQLLRQALTEVDSEVIIDLYLTRRAYNTTVSTIIVNELPEDSMIILIEAVGCLWGNKLFIARGDEKLQEYLTTSLVAALERIDEATLSQRGPRGIPLAMIISSGVSAYLDSSDRMSRLRGMRVAVAFSTLMNSPIVFDELQEYYEQVKREEEEEDKYMQALLKETKKSPGSTDSISVGGGNDRNVDKLSGQGNVKDNGDDDDEIKSVGSSDNDNDNDNDNDSDSDSEIEAYDLGEDATMSNPFPRIKPVTFLRVCLEHLQYPDSQEKAFEKHQSALVSIPKIVANQPADAGDVCGPLVRELLSFSNSFNMDNFDQLRTAALQSLLTNYPTISVKVISSSLESETVGLGVKINAIAALARASYTLAGLPIPGEEGKDDKMIESDSKNSLATSISNSPSPSPSQPSSSVTNNASTFSGMTSSKTIVKRPAKLAQSQRKRHYFRNNFAPVSHLFYYPILKLIASLCTKMDAGKGSDSIDLSSFSSLSTSSSSSSTSFSCMSNSTSLDEIEYLLFAQALLALGAFVRCCINSTAQKQLILDTLKVASKFVQSTSLALRRASLVAFHSCIEARLQQRSTSTRMQAIDVTAAGNANSAMGVLTNLTRLTDNNNNSNINSNSGGGSNRTEEEDVMMAAFIEWAVSTIKNDPDPHCRALKCDAVEMAMKSLDIL